jgi:cephalosporin hydroxylase
LPDRERLEELVREFAVAFDRLRDQTYMRTRWLGVPVVKPPSDILVLQEILTETRPDLIIETGVLSGGSSLFFASLMDLLGIDGRVLGVDPDQSLVHPRAVEHPRIELIEGDSTEPAVAERLAAEAEGRRVMVDLDADHHQEHVTAELRLLAPLVSPGCYLIVEDTWHGGRPLAIDEDPGPGAAVDAWLAEGQPFEVDRWRERMLLTGNPGGFLRRVGGEPVEDPPRPDDYFVPRAEARSPSPEEIEATQRHEAQRAERVGLELRYEIQVDTLKDRIKELEDEIQGRPHPDA